MTNKFSKKATAGNTGSSDQEGASPEQWNEWNQYQFDQFSAKVKEMPNGKQRKEKTLIGRVGLIMDLGYPITKDSEWDTKCALPEGDETYSKEEQSHMQANPTHDFKFVKDWDSNANGGKGGMVQVRKQTSPSYAAQEYGVAIDFPSIMIDWSKHPYSEDDTPKLAPYRISLNNVFNREIQRTIVFDGSYKPVSDKNILYKVCQAAGLEKELIDSGFDIATLAEATCNFQVRMDITTGDKIYLNDSVSKPSQVDDLEMPDESIYTADAQIKKVMDKEGIADFCGILLDGMDYTEEMFNMLGEDKFGYLKRAETSHTYEISGISKKTNEAYSFEKGLDYASTDFAKAYEKHRASKSSSTQPKTASKSEPKQPQAKVEKKVTEPKTTFNEPVMDFDDDIPF